MGYCIYKICSDDCEYVYVGSTKNITKRKYHHKSDCNKEDGKNFHYKLYKIIRENGGWDNWRMVCIEELGDITKREAEIREEFWRQNLKANMNVKKSYQTKEERKEYLKRYDKEYREENKDIITQNKQKNREKNRDKIAEQRKEKTICECGCEIRKNDLARHKRSKKHLELMSQNL